MCAPTMLPMTVLACSYDRLTPDNAVLLLIDPQVGPLWELEAAELRRQLTTLARTARRLTLPTIVTSIAYDDLGPIIPELSDAAREDEIVERGFGNAWDDTRVRRAVESTGRRKLIVAGSVTDAGVAPCAIAAAAAGFDVCAPIESTPSSQLAVRRMIEAGVVVTTFSLVIAEIVRGDARSRVLALRH